MLYIDRMPKPLKPTLAERSRAIEASCTAVYIANARRREADVAVARREDAAWARQGEKEANALRFTEVRSCGGVLCTK
jgi:hypothetical protein